MKKKVELFYELMLVWFSDNLGENVRRRKEKKKWKERKKERKKGGKVKNKFKIDKLFLYVSSNSFHSLYKN